MPDSSRIRQCAECGTPIDSGDRLCWACQWKLAGGENQNPFAAPQAISDNVANQFSLASLFLVMTLVAVCVGVWMQSPGLGALLTVFAAPALVRTAIDAWQHKRRGTPLGAVGKVTTFFVSVLVVGVVALASGTAFLTLCFAGIAAGQQDRTLGPFGDAFAWVLIFGSPLAGLATAIAVFWAMRPRG